MEAVPSPIHIGFSLKRAQDRTVNLRKGARIKGASIKGACIKGARKKGAHIKGARKKGDRKKGAA